MGNSFISNRPRITRGILSLLFFIFCFLLALRPVHQSFSEGGSFSVGGSSAFAESKPLKIHFIDVGEGDSILIEAPNGEAALIDAGNLISGFRVAEYLKENDIQDLEYLIFTHPHLDHIGGAFFVLQMLKVKNVYDNGEDLSGLVKSSDLYRWYATLARREENYRVLKTEDILSLGEVSLKVLWPPRPFVLSDFNSNSLVIMLRYGKFSCLLTGDLTSIAEEMLLGAGVDLKADVLKVGHHGAGDASSEEFLDEVSPQIAIISVNAENIRGYPSMAVLEKLRTVGSGVYRTDEQGDIVLTVFPKGQFEIKSEIYEKR